jgi:SAM-dependent methyltransferase
MSDWQERITHETPPAIQAEHELRYRLAAPLIAASAIWVDLGCGNGIAAARALGKARPASALLVDVDPDTVARAAAELGVPGAGMPGDLTDARFLERLGAALSGAEGERLVTAFEVVEHLASFVPLLEWAVELARSSGVTFVMSVPNDAFWSIRNPHHATSWGEGAFEELQRLLPDERTLLRQVALAGSALVDWDAGAVEHELHVNAGGAGTVTTHFIAAFGPRHEGVSRGALAVQTDSLAQRRWERQRESDLAFLEARASERGVEKLEATIAEQSEQLGRHSVWFEEWRAYIHELERMLGLPLSGASPEDLPTGASPEDLPTGASPEDLPTGASPEDLPTGASPEDLPPGARGGENAEAQQEAGAASSASAGRSA